MNSVPNSDSELCTESKLGWVQQVHNLAQLARTSCKHYAQAGRVVGLCPADRVTGLVGHVVSLAGRVAGLVGRVASLVGRVAACIATHPAPRSCTSAVSRAVVRVATPLRRVAGR